MRKVAIVLLVTALLSSCATAPKYETPPTPQAAAGPFVTRPAGVDTAQAPRDDWWRLYDDPVLDRLIAQAFAANTDLRIAEANLRRSRAVLRETRTAWLPSTDLTGGATYGDAPTESGPTTGRSWTYDADFAVAWEVDLFGRLGSAIRAASADAQAAQAARDLVRITVAADTARAYSDACAFGDAVSIARASAKMARESLSLVSAQERAGSTSRLDVDRAATAAARADAAAPPIEDLRRASLFELAALLGLTPSQVPAEAAACVRTPTPHAELPIGDGAQLLRRRPDVREAERRLAADTARIGLAVADLYPRVTLGGSGGYLKGDSTTKAEEFSFSVGPMISWSFPNVTAARARIRQARAGSDATLAAFDGVVLTALKETEQALSAFGAATDRQRSLSTARLRADHAFRLAGERYRAGTLSYLDVLVAQRELLDVSADYASANQNLGAARVRLFKALGGGWNSDRPAVSGQP